MGRNTELPSTVSFGREICGDLAQAERVASIGRAPEWVACALEAWWRIREATRRPRLKNRKDNR
jgi:hypothetical protein